MGDDLPDLAPYEELIERWLARQLETNPLALAVDRDPDLARWYLRLRGEERDFTTIWITLGQRTLQYETYFMPAPEEAQEAVYEYLLRRNHKLFGMRFSIGPENAIFLVGHHTKNLSKVCCGCRLGRFGERIFRIGEVFRQKPRR